MTRTSPLRHGNQQGSVSGKTERLLELHQADLSTRYSPRTIEGYLTHVRHFLDWLAARHLTLLQVRREDLHGFQSDLAAHRKPAGGPYSISHQNGAVTAVQCLFRFLYRRGFLLHDPSTGLERAREDQTLPRSILSPKEAARVVEAARERTPIGLRDRAILETLYATGLRVSELADLTVHDVDTEERLLRVVLGKGRKDRNVPLTRAAATAIEEYVLKGRKHLVRRAQDRRLFPADLGGRMQRAVLARLVRGYARKAGIKKRVTPHTFRHSMATHLLRGRADIRHIQVLLGHAKLSTTERYTRVEVTDLKRVVERAHPRGR
jgi:integrase/recombinase XerD